MRIYIAYRFTGVPKSQLDELIDPVVKTLKQEGYDAFCNYYSDEKYKREKYDLKRIMNHCYSELEDRDVVLCLIDTKELSCGMLLELGYAFAKEKKVIVFSRIGCEIPTVKEMVDEHYTYKDYDELQNYMNYAKHIFKKK